MAAAHRAALLTCSIWAPFLIRIPARAHPTFKDKGKTVEYLIGAGLALSVSLLARFVGLDRDRAFYPIVMIVIASYYGLFAVMGGSMRALGLESIAIAGFLLITILGFKLNLWFVVGASERHV